MAEKNTPNSDDTGQAGGAGNHKSGSGQDDTLCPVCGAELISEKCKVICRSETCRYRIVFNCAEF